MCVWVSGMYPGDAHSDCVGESGGVGRLIGDADVVDCRCCCEVGRAEASFQYESP